MKATPQHNDFMNVSESLYVFVTNCKLSLLPPQSIIQPTVCAQETLSIPTFSPGVAVPPRFDKL